MNWEQKCTLCHIACNTKKEMDKHIGSMLHHMELENLKGRAGEASYPDRETDCRRLQRRQEHHELQEDTGRQPLASLFSCLPDFLQKELIWCTNLMRKTGSHLPEPNLSRARRVRSVCQMSPTEKDLDLIPILWEIISKPGRNVHWEHFIQQMREKKQERLKGLPRFGIQMAASVPPLQGALPLGVRTSPASLAAPIQESTPATFQTTSSIGAITVPELLVEIKQQPASPGNARSEQRMVSTHFSSVRKQRKRRRGKKRKRSQTQ